jgi:hypothetical protein
MDDARIPFAHYLRWFLDGASMPLLLLGPVLFWVFVLVSLPFLLPVAALFGFHGWEAAPLLLGDLLAAWVLLRELVFRIVCGRRTRLLVLTAAWLWAVVPCVALWTLFALSGAD